MHVLNSDNSKQSMDYCYFFESNVGIKRESVAYCALKKSKQCSFCEESSNRDSSCVASS